MAELPFSINTVLLCPAHKRERVQDALQSAADVVLYDLEDGVQLQSKAEARSNLQEVFQHKQSKSPRLAIRMNALDTLQAWEDILFFQSFATAPSYLVVPRVCCARDLQLVYNLMHHFWPQLQMLSMIETAAGVQELNAITQVRLPLAGIIIGGADLSMDLGCANNSYGLETARTLCVIAAAANNLMLIDTPYFGNESVEGLVAECKDSYALGCTGKMALHEKDIPVIAETFSYNQEAIDAALKLILDAQQPSDQGYDALANMAALKKAKSLLRRYRISFQ